MTVTLLMNAQAHAVHGRAARISLGSLSSPKHVPLAAIVAAAVCVQPFAVSKLLLVCFRPIKLFPKWYCKDQCQLTWSM